MLIISRRRGETVEIDDKILITIEKIFDSKGENIKGAKVKLSVKAPQEIVINFPPKNEQG